MTDIKKTLAELSDDEVRDEGLRLACNYLEKRGWDIVEASCSVVDGMAAIEARDDEVAVMAIVQVESNPNGDPYVMPELDINRDKAARYRKLMLEYLSLNPDVDTARFDIISIRLLSDHNAKLRHLVGLFDWNA